MFVIESSSSQTHVDSDQSLFSKRSRLIKESIFEQIGPIVTTHPGTSNETFLHLHRIMTTSNYYNA